MSVAKKAARPRPEPFAITNHRWLPYDHLSDVKPEDILRPPKPGRLILVRAHLTNVSYGNVDKGNGQANSDALDGLGLLLHRAEKGDQDAACKAAETLRLMCFRLSQLCKDRPALFQKTARLSWGWPVMMSTHPRLCDDYKTILESLQLGAGVPFMLDRYSKWKLDDGTKIAAELLFYIRASRKENQSKFFNIDYGEIGESASALPRFTKHSANEWWALAFDIFRFSYPHPEKIPEFASLIKTPTRRKSAGRLKHAIFDLIKSRFMSLAGR